VSARRVARGPRPGALTLTVVESVSAVLLRMAGDLDLANVGQVMAALERVDLARTDLLVFDLQDVAFLDIAGLTTILRFNDHCRDQGGRVTVVKPRGLASRVFTLTRVHRDLDLVDSAYGLQPRKGLPRNEPVRTTSRGSTHPSYRGQLAAPPPGA
jgi:anti-sigma B factor antagonist